MKNEENDWARLRQRLDEILDEAMQADGASSGNIRIVDAGSRLLRICVHRGLSVGFLARFADATPDDATLCAEAQRRGRRVVVADVGRDGSRSELAALGRSDGFRGVQATPIIASDGTVIGTLTTQFAQVHRPSKSAELVLDYCARRAAEIIEKIGFAQEQSGV